VRLPSKVIKYGEWLILTRHFGRSGQKLPVNGRPAAGTRY